jgi:hypothetical protein
MTQKKIHAINLLMVISLKIIFLPRSQYGRSVSIVKSKISKSMMPIYSSILMSSLLLSGITVELQTFETRSTFFSEDKSVPEFLIAQAINQMVYADSDQNSPPDRGTGR